MITSHDLFDRLSLPTLPRLGDTEYALLPSSARRTAGLAESWDERVPVVYAGDGTQSQASLNGGPLDAVAAAAAAALPSTPSFGGVFSSAINHTLLGIAGIVVLGIGVFILVKE